MDSFDFHNIKMEKANARLKYHKLQRITAMFRLMELCIFLIMISRFTAQIPVAFKLSGEYFRGISVAAVSPRFVFILGNAIVIVLFVKSGKLSAQDDFYREYVKNCEKDPSVFKEEQQKPRKQSSSCEDKEVVNSDPYNERMVKIQRCQSENLKRVRQPEEGSRELRRSATVKCRGSEDCEEKPEVVRSCKEDEMSSEEFRRTVEAFIARQQRFLREEEDFSATVSFETYS